MMGRSSTSKYLITCVYLFSKQSCIVFQFLLESALITVTSSVRLYLSFKGERGSKVDSQAAKWFRKLSQFSRYLLWLVKLFPSRNQKKRSKQRAEYLQKREDILSQENKAKARARYKADPEKKKASVRDTYKADPEKKASVRDTYKADPEKKKGSVRDTYNANAVV
eukprot:Em0002g1002a